MFFRPARTLIALTALALLLPACSGSPSATPSVATPITGMAPAPGGDMAAAVTRTKSHFHPATAAQRKAKRPSLEKFGDAARRDMMGHYTLITWLDSDQNLDFSYPTKSCDTLFQDAPWYVATSNLTLSLPDQTIDACVDTSTGTVATGNLYVVKVEIGWLTLQVEPLAGPASINGNLWTFGPLQKSTAFSADSIYTFFVANWSGSGTPPTVDL
jgi:hypothetical protein